ncbi:hypothetical protein MaudCBS49596_000425 [Microsporum audouinii]
MNRTLNMDVNIENKRRNKRRPVKTRATPDKLDACYQKISETSRAIRTLERLTGRGPALVNAAIGILTSSPSQRDETVYQLFLRDVLRLCGRGLTLLCAASLGKQRVSALSEDQRTHLVRHLKHNRDSLECDCLETIAEEHGIPLPSGL